MASSVFYEISLLRHRWSMLTVDTDCREWYCFPWRLPPQRDRWSRTHGRATALWYWPMLPGDAIWNLCCMLAAIELKKGKANKRIQNLDVMSQQNKWGVMTNEEPQLLSKIQTRKKFNRMLFIRTKHNMQIFGVIPFIKLQNNTWGLNDEKNVQNQMEG